MFQKFLTSHMAFSHNVFLKFQTVSRTYIGMHDIWKGKKEIKGF